MWFNQRGVIVPLVLFGTLVVLSGIGLFLYLLYYPKQNVSAPKIVVPSMIPQASRAPIVSDFDSCSKAGNPVAESYPRTCRSDGRVFSEIITESVASPSAGPLTSSLFESYSDSYMSLYYPQGFVSMELGFASKFAHAERVKSLSFFAPQSDNGFTLELWSNKDKVSVSEWWQQQFKDVSGNEVHGSVLKVSDLALGSEQIGPYMVYSLSLETQGVVKIFRFKDYIAVFSSTMGTDTMNKVIESIK